MTFPIWSHSRILLRQLKNPFVTNGVTIKSRGYRNMASICLCLERIIQDWLFKTTAQDGGIDIYERLAYICTNNHIHEIHTDSST